MTYEDSDNELSVSDVIRRVWQRRGLLVTAPVVFFAVAAIALGFMSLQVRNPISYFVSLKSIENGQYPNGTAFAPTDLLIPEVIASVAQQFGLEDLGTLRRAFSVRYGSVLEDSVNEKYRNMLSARNLTVAEIDTMNANYTAELSRVVGASLRIDFDYVSLGFDNGTGSAIAAALPEAWTTIYPQLFKVVVDTKLQDVSVSGGTLELNDTASLLLAENALRSLRSGLTIISEDNRINSLTTAAGNNGADLIQALGRFRTEYFNPLFYSAANTGPVSITYIRQLESDISDQRRQFEGLSKTVQDLRDFQNVQPANGSSQDSQPAGNTGGLQLSDSGLAEIVGLAQRATLSDYLREVLDRRQAVLIEISGLEKELAILKNPVTANLGQPFAAAATSQLKTLVDGYNELLASARSRLNERMGDLYVPVSSPEVTGSFLPPRSLLVLLLSVVIGATIALIAALLLPVRRVP
ncbi:MAG: hypothetical protein H0T56_05145 [Pseudaminobacter sp.]|nr:hypothetical protein [Pseudaminobacter sp.]